MKRCKTWRQALGVAVMALMTGAAGWMGGVPEAHAHSVVQEPDWVAGLARSPRWQAAQQAHRAALARADASGGNPNDWIPQASWAQRSQRAEPGQLASSNSREWSVGLSRGVRLASKVNAAEDWAQRLREWADADLAQAWLLLCREALSDAGELTLSQQQASLLRAHADNLATQHQGLRRRHELGDAARQDVILADAARAQADAQATLADQRARSLQSRWLARYPGLPTPPFHAAAVAGPPASAEAIQARLSQHPQWVAAERRVLALRAQARQALSERQPDPVVGVQYGRERSGAERVLGVSLSWPIGAEVRSSQAQAQLAEAESAQAELEDLRRSLGADLDRWWAEATHSREGAQASEHALQQTELAEQALRRGQALGQVSTSEVLQMQRQLIDQRQVAAQVRVTAWLASMRWSLESGQWWPQPPADGTDVAQR